MGKPEQAILPLQEATRLEPKDAVNRYLGNNKEGLAAFKCAAMLNPSIGEFHVNLARAYLRLRNKDAALVAYTALKMIDSAPAKIIYDEVFQDRILSLH